MPKGIELSEVFAANARALRDSATLDDVARASRLHGANWTPGKVSDLEHGRVSPTLPNLVIAAFALGEVRGTNVTVADLLDSDQTIRLTKGFDITSDELKSILSGDEAAYSRLLSQAINRAAKGADALAESRRTWPARLQNIKIGPFRRVSADYGEAESLLAREFGLDRDRLVAEMAALWKKSFRAERDERAGAGANAQKKGRLARELKTELRAVLDGDH